jgi:hypothetical protein
MIGVMLSGAYPGRWLPLAIFYSVFAGFSLLLRLAFAAPWEQ